MSTSASENAATRPKAASLMPNAGLLLRRKCACGSSPGLSGECEACTKNRLQRKLTIGASNDPLEKEADRVADQVIEISPNRGLHRVPPRIQRSAGQANGVADTAPSSVDRVLASPGRALDPPLQQDMGRRFGYDFSHVRVHTGVEAEQSARDVNAHAYTTGNNVVFGAGRYVPESLEGQRLIAHELAHVVQQENTHSKIQRRVIDDHVVTTPTILTTLGLTRQQIIDAIRTADAGAIVLARDAENELTSQLAIAVGGGAVNASSEQILNEELGLSYNNVAHRGLIRQQASRFRRVRETLESGYLRYMALGIGSVSLVGCAPGTCGNNFAFSCPANRLIVLCQTFWDSPAEQDDTILHEPFHVWFHMARHANNALRRADASCFESFALRVSGTAATASCVGHTAG